MGEKSGAIVLFLSEIMQRNCHECQFFVFFFFCDICMWLDSLRTHAWVQCRVSFGSEVSKRARHLGKDKRSSRTPRLNATHASFFGWLFPWPFFLSRDAPVSNYNCTMLSFKIWTSRKFCWVPWKKKNNKWQEPIWWAPVNDWMNNERLELTNGLFVR